MLCNHLFNPEPTATEDARRRHWLRVKRTPNPLQSGPRPKAYHASIVAETHKVPNPVPRPCDTELGICRSRLVKATDGPARPRRRNPFSAAAATRCTGGQCSAADGMASIHRRPCCTLACALCTVRQAFQPDRGLCVRLESLTYFLLRPIRQFRRNGPVFRQCTFARHSGPKSPNGPARRSALHPCCNFASIARSAGIRILPCRSSSTYWA